jgi:hypothetical protein
VIDSLERRIAFYQGILKRYEPELEKLLAQVESLNG